MMSYGKDYPEDMDSLENSRRATADAVHRELEEDREKFLAQIDLYKNVD